MVPMAFSTCRQRVWRSVASVAAASVTPLQLCYKYCHHIWLNWSLMTLQIYALSAWAPCTCAIIEGPSHEYTGISLYTCTRYSSAVEHYPLYISELVHVSHQKAHFIARHRMVIANTRKFASYSHGIMYTCSQHMAKMLAPLTWIDLNVRLRKARVYVPIMCSNFLTSI